LGTNRFFLIIFLLVICIIIIQHVSLPIGFCQSFGVEKHSPDQRENKIGSVSYFLYFYQRFISVFDGDRCPMSPSCSAYSIQCFRKHGFFWGWILTCDRLLHEPDEIGRAPLIFSNGRIRYYDPVEENDRLIQK